jgi:hypothetical protein
VRGGGDYLEVAEPKTGALYVINLAASLERELYRFRSMHNAAAGADGNENTVAL